MENNTIVNLIPSVKTEEPFVGGYGNLDAEYMVVIPEAPLSANGLFPCTEKQLAYFRQLITAHWKSAYITPLVKYRRNSAAKTLYVREIREWLPVLYREIDIVRPKRILVMGKFAAKALIPHFDNMRNDHGALFTVSGADIDSSLSHIGEIVLVPTFTFYETTFTNKMARDYMLRDLNRFRYVEVTKPEWEVIEDISETPVYEGETVTVDVETDGLELDSTIHKIGVGTKSGIYIANYPDSDSLRRLFEKVNDTDSHFAFHNTTFDLAQITNSSRPTVSNLRNRVEDTMVMAHLSGEKIKSLKHLTAMYTDLPGPHSGGSFHDDQYLAEDVRSTQALLSVPEINETKGSYANDLYHDLAPIFVKMRLSGVYIDRDMILELLVRGEKDLAEATTHLNSFVPKDYGDLNWNSVQQVVKLFMGVHQVPLTEKTPTGNYTIAEGVLEELAAELKEYGNNYKPQIEMIEALLSYRSKTKLVSGFLRSYLDLLDDNGFVYPNLKLLGTATGRLSCADPNLQQIPRVGDFKLCFKPRWNDGRYTTAFAPGYYGLVDFAGAELRMAAIISGDEQMAEFILSGDPHSHMARIAFPNQIPNNATNKQIKEEFAYWRKRSKSTTFAMLYGGSVKGIAFKNGVPESEVGAVETALRKAAPRLMNWLDRTKAECVRTLKIKTLFGNQRNLTDKMLYEGKGGVERAGINTPIQGASGILALIVLRKLYQLCEEHNTVSRPIFGVHDSILSEIAEHEVELYSQLVQEAYLDIENSPIVDYPVYHMLGIQGDLEIGRTWAHTESTNEHCDILHSIACDSRGE